MEMDNGGGRTETRAALYILIPDFIFPEFGGKCQEWLLLAA
jgi:hypothetical protein